MDLLERYQTVIVILAVLGGLAVGQVQGVPALAESSILVFLLVMLFGAFARIPPSGLREAFRNRRVVGASLGINFLWNPLLAVALGALFLRGHPALWVGLIILMVTPCTDWYLVFTDVAGGDVALATSLLPYNLVLQLVLLPVYLYVFAGALVSLPLDLLVESVLLVLAVPLAAATLVRRGAIRTRGRDWFDRAVVPRLAPVQIVFLCLAIAAMFASQGEVVLEEPGVLALIAVPVLVFYVVNFLVGLGVGRLLSFSYEEVACLDCTILSRNSPTALAIAVVAFPDEPLIPLALVIGPLLELPLLSVVSRLLLAMRDRRLWSGTDPAAGSD